MKKVLVTGATGFAGSFLCEYLVQQNDCEVFGTYLTESSLQNIHHIQEKLKLVQVDLSNPDSVSSIISDIQPDYIYHLAALASPHASFETPQITITSNIASQISLLEAVKKNKLLGTKILIVSSGEIYGAVRNQDLPIDELAPLRPTSPYAVSKIAQDYLGLQYFLSHKLLVIRIRPFNHIGPRQSPNFVVASFAKKIAEIEKGKQKSLTVGNLDSKRDFTDVRDMVRCYHMLLEKGEVGEVYNAGTGKSVLIKDVLEKLLSFSTIKISVEKDPSLMRPSDIPELRCNAAKLSKVTGWQAEIPLSKTLKDTLDYWRNIV